MSSSKEEQEIDKIVGNVLRYYRHKTGIGQVKLGEESGISMQQIQKYEKAACRVSVSKLYSMCEAMNMSVLDFMGEVLKEKGRREENLGETPPLGQKQFYLLSMFDDFDEVQQNMILDMMKQFGKKQKVYL